MAPWQWIRVLKFFGLAGFVAGLVGAVVPSARRSRLLMTYAYLVPGFIATYAAGWLLMKLTGRSLDAPWLWMGTLTGLGALHVGYLASHQRIVRTATPIVAWGCAGAALSVMIVRVDSAGALLFTSALGLVFGALAAWPWAQKSPSSSDEDRRIIARALLWMTRVEGASLVFMLFVSMPLRLLFGIKIDGGTGLIGWVHGLLFLLFLQTLASARPYFDLPMSELVRGLGSAMVPGGNLWFEKRLKRRWLDHA